MLFNSPTYVLLLLPAAAIVFFLLRRWNATVSRVWLVGSSLFFFGSWNPVCLWLIVASIAFNFLIARRFRQAAEPERRRKILLIAGVAANLGLLVYFKYTNFLVDKINWLVGGTLPAFDIVLPLAISFFTFQQIACLVDSSRQRVQPHSPLEYSLFVTFFPS